MARLTLEQELAALAELPPAQLRDKWTGLTRRPVPRVSPKLLRLALAWELQAKVHGGLSRKTQQKLAQLASAKTTTREAQPGMRLVREWNGKLHIVTIGEDKVIRWNEREWQSLSEVARAITGIRSMTWWSSAWSSRRAPRLHTWAWLVKRQICAPLRVRSSTRRLLIPNVKPRSLFTSPARGCAIATAIGC